jgi:crotonobetainyl-CoA:carnitine CoA-transferase CaiB-like acyl-CoA transferase
MFFVFGLRKRLEEALVMEPNSSLPLSGVRVVDFTHGWAGPHATRMLADFGAEVIKIENPRRMDFIRGGRKENQAYNRQPAWLQLNRNKLSVALDLRDAKRVEVVKDLVRISDVVVESSRAGVMQRLGLGYDDLRSIRPDIIMLSMSGFGQTGPEAKYAAYGGSLEPLSGIQALTGYSEGERPARIREIDVTNGLVGACAVLTALYHRQRTGRGQFLDLSQLEACTVALSGAHLLEYEMNGSQPPRRGNRHRSYAPQGCYRCRGDDKWITLVIRTEQEWRALCETIGRPELIGDERFTGPVARTQNHDLLDQLIEGWTAGRDNMEAMRVLQQSGVCAGAVLDVADLAADPHLQERSYFQSPPSSASQRFPGSPFKSSGTPGVIRPGPRLGEHNQYVLGELLGLPAEDAALLPEDQIGTEYDIH